MAMIKNKESRRRQNNAVYITEEKDESEVAKLNTSALILGAPLCGAISEFLLQPTLKAKGCRILQQQKMHIALVDSDSSEEILTIITVFPLFAISLLRSASSVTFLVASGSLLCSPALVALHALHETEYSTGDVIEAV